MNFQYLKPADCHAVWGAVPKEQTPALQALMKSGQLIAARKTLVAEATRLLQGRRQVAALDYCLALEHAAKLYLENHPNITQAIS